MVSTFIVIEMRKKNFSIQFKRAKNRFDYVSISNNLTIQAQLKHNIFKYNKIIEINLYYYTKIKKKKNTK